MKLCWCEAYWINLWEPKLRQRSLEFQIVPYKLEVEAFVVDLSYILEAQFRWKPGSESLILADCGLPSTIYINVDWRLSPFIRSIVCIKLCELIHGDLSLFVFSHGSIN